MPETPNSLSDYLKSGNPENIDTTKTDDSAKLEAENLANLELEKKGTDTTKTDNQDSLPDFLKDNKEGDPSKISITEGKEIEAAVNYIKEKHGIEISTEGKFSLDHVLDEFHSKLYPSDAVKTIAELSKNPEFDIVDYLQNIQQTDFSNIPNEDLVSFAIQQQYPKATEAQIKEQVEKIKTDSKLDIVGNQVRAELEKEAKENLNNFIKSFNQPKVEQEKQQQEEFKGWVKDITDHLSKTDEINGTPITKDDKRSIYNYTTKINDKTNLTEFWEDFNNADTKLIHAIARTMQLHKQGTSDYQKGLKDGMEKGKSIVLKEVNGEKPKPNGSNNNVPKGKNSLVEMNERLKRGEHLYN